VPDLADAPAATRRAVAHWLQDLYPGDHPDTLSSLRPHLLAEHLAVRELAAAESFASRALRDLSEESSHHAFTLLGQAAKHDKRAIQLIVDAVEEDPERMILPAVTATVETGVRLDAILAAQIQAARLNLLQLTRVSAAIPRRSQSLDRTATVVRRRVIETGAVQLSQRRGITANHAELGRRQTELMELARVNRLLQEEGRILPARTRKQLLSALQNQEKSLIQDGQLSEALDISEQIAWLKNN
jgi:hypothetical protein